MYVHVVYVDKVKDEAVWKESLFFGGYRNKFLWAKEPLEGFLIIPHKVASKVQFIM